MNGDRLAQPRRCQLHAPLEGAGHHPHEGDPVAMLRIHVGLDLEDETRHLVAVRRNLAAFAWLRARRRGETGNRVNQFADTEVLERGTEKDGRQIAVAIGFQIEFGIADPRQLDLFGQLGRQIARRLALAQELLAVAFRDGHGPAGEIENTPEQPAHAKRRALR